jgi:hypothetical protein
MLQTDDFDLRLRPGARHFSAINLIERFATLDRQRFLYPREAAIDHAPKSGWSLLHSIGLNPKPR